MKRATARPNISEKVRLTLGMALAVASVFCLTLSSNAHAAADDISDLSAMHVYYGTTHTHTGADNDHGGDNSHAADVFAAAKANHFDFVFLTEHSGPTGPKNPGDYYRNAQVAAANATENGVFVGFAGYEYSENGGDGDSDSGHMTGYGTEQFINASAPGWNFRTFMDYLASQGGYGALGGFNHPPATGHKASKATLLTTARRNAIVMSEVQHKVAFIPNEESDFYKAFIIELDRGWRVAPTCGLDGHGLGAMRAKETASRKPCRTGIVTSSLTKANLLSALEDRRIYTTRDTDLSVKYKVNGNWMGSTISRPSSANFTITISDPDTYNANDKIRRIDIIGSGGRVLASKAFSSHSATWQPSIPVGYNQYMFIRVFNGERSTHTAVAAPVWFDSGR